MRVICAQLLFTAANARLYRPAGKRLPPYSNVCATDTQLNWLWASHKLLTTSGTGNTWARQHAAAPDRSQTPGSVLNMSARELKERLEVLRIQAATDGVRADDPDAETEGPQLIDVREPFEADLAAIPEFALLPTSRFAEWAPQVDKRLDPSKETIVLCHHGIRSMQVAQFLASRGFQTVYNVSGGIDAYSREDPAVPQY